MTEIFLKCLVSNVGMDSRELRIPKNRIKKVQRMFKLAKRTKSRGNPIFEARRNIKEFKRKSTLNKIPPKNS